MSDLGEPSFKFFAFQCFRRIGGCGSKIFHYLKQIFLKIGEESTGDQRDRVQVGVIKKINCNVSQYLILILILFYEFRKQVK